MVRKPDWLVNLLGHLNWDIFTWHVYVGDTLEGAIDWVLEPINALVDWALRIYAYWEDFRQEVVDFFTEIPKWINEVWQFVLNFFDTIGDYINTWWSGVVDTVKGWIEVAKQFVLDIIDTLQHTVDRVDTSLSNFFTLTLPSLARKLDVGDLITAALLPLRTAFNLVEQFKKEITDFFGDPYQWVYDRLDKFFERFW